VNEPNEPNVPMVDVDTGLLTENYFRVALPQRVATARRLLRPLAVVLISAASAPSPRPRGDGDVALEVTRALQASLRESDTACRLSDRTFALVLEDTLENGAVWAVERLRRLLDQKGAPVTVWAGIACYPAHGLDASEVYDQARTALAGAISWPTSRIEVAVTQPD
jgi:GGDEF domain-containing protein